MNVVEPCVHFYTYDAFSPMKDSDDISVIETDIENRTVTPILILLIKYLIQEVVKLTYIMPLSNLQSKRS